MTESTYEILITDLTETEIRGTTQDETSRAIVNGVEVYESSAEVMWFAQKDN